MIHLELKNVKYFDDNEGKYVDADFKVMDADFKFKITTYKKKEMWKIIEGNLPKLLSYRVLSVSDNKVEIEFCQSMVAIISQNDYEQLKKLCENNISDEDDFKLSVKNIVDHIYDVIINQDEEMMSMVKKLVAEIPIEIYSNPINLITLESIILFLNAGGDYLVESEELIRGQYFKIIREREGDELSYTPTIDTNCTAYQVYKTIVYPLAQLLSNRYSGLEIPVQQGVYISYLLIFTEYKAMLANSWELEYGQYFSDVDNKSAIELTMDFLNIDMINHERSDISCKFVCYLMQKNKLLENNNIIQCLINYSDIYNAVKEHIDLQRFSDRLKQDKKSESNPILTIDDIDLMTGQEFEELVSELFERMGYKTEITKASGDQGIDVLATKGNIKLGIQAKCYSGSVGNAAIQEAVAGKAYYNLDKVLVLTNSTFTASAIELAQVNNVVLWDRTLLKEKIS